MAVSSVHLGVCSWSRHSKLNVRMGKKGDLSSFERGMAVGNNPIHYKLITLYTTRLSN